MYNLLCFCRNCGKEIDDHAWVCMGCGVKVGQRNRDGKLITHHCDRCGMPVSEYQSICTQCGNLVDETVKQAEQAKTKNQRTAPKQTLYSCYKDAWRIRVNEVATRRQYWGAWFFNFIFGLLFFLANQLIAWIALITSNYIFFGIIGVIIGVAYFAYGVAMLVIFIPLTIRRLHDAGFSGLIVRLRRLVLLLPLLAAGFVATADHSARGWLWM